MAKKNKIKQLETSEKFEGSADAVDLKGKDGGKMGILSRFFFSPNELFYKETQAEQDKIVIGTLEKLLFDHCSKIGWWPEARFDGKPYRIEQQEDKSYMLVAYLKRGVRAGSKLAAQIESVAGTINIDER